MRPSWNTSACSSIDSCARMATTETGQAGFEHVERLESSRPAPKVGTALDTPPPPRRTTRPSSGRPRPVSMPPVAAAESLNGQPASEQPEHRSQHHSSSRRGTSRATVRVIGNYSLGKTLGAGSMGKVKLAYHNQTGEKVSSVALCGSCGHCSSVTPSSLLSK